MMYSTGYPYNRNVFQTGHAAATTPCTSTQMYNPCSYYPRYIDHSSPTNATAPYPTTMNRDYPPPLSHPNDPTRGYYSPIYRQDNASTYYRTNDQGGPTNQDYIPNQANQQCRFALNNTFDNYSENCDEGTNVFLVNHLFAM